MGPEMPYKELSWYAIEPLIPDVESRSGFCWYGETDRYNLPSCRSLDGIGKILTLLPMI